MTVKHDENGNGTVRLGTRDWISLITIIAGAACGVLFRMEFVENRIDAKLETMRSEWTLQAPSPAMWTKDSIARIDRDIERLRVEIKEMRQGK